jgi:hypothetical protein
MPTAGLTGKATKAAGEFLVDTKRLEQGVRYRVLMKN